MSAGSLIRVVAQVDSEGRIALPRNILIAMDMKEKDIVELRVIRSVKANKVTISKRLDCR